MGNGPGRAIPPSRRGPGFAAATIADHVKKLREVGWLGVQGNRGRNQSNRYTLMIPAMYEALIEQTLGPENVHWVDLLREKTSSLTTEKVRLENRTSGWVDPSLPKPSIEPPTQVDLEPSWMAEGMSWRDYVQNLREEQERSEEEHASRSA